MAETTGRTGLVTRVRAALRGERRAEALEALRDAGAAVYGELSQAEKIRAGLFGGTGDVWSASRAVNAQLLATWNAFVLQTLGEALLDADYAADPGTVGYVPPVTFEQAWSWLATAAQWLSVARQAQANPGYDPLTVFGLPADPPAFAEAEPCPPAHLQAMITAIPAVRDHAELALFDLDRSSGAADRRQQVDRLRQVAAEAAAAADYAQRLYQSTPDRRLHEYIETHLKRALVLWFHLGQLAAMPTLIEHYRIGEAPTRLDPAMLPGGARFDPWCLTDPRTRAHWQADPRARRAIQAMWAADPDPVSTLAVQAEIERAVAAGDIAEASGIGHFYCCPWPSIYQVRRPVRIGGRHLAPAQQFTFEISAEKMAEGGSFVRRILTGPFQPTTEVDYCDPAAGGHHD